jgi:DNA-binding HxlR family transcriptional regulator
MEGRKVSSTNYQNEQQLNRCPVSFTLSLIGGRWKAAIIWKLSAGNLRFSQLRAQIGGISDRILTKQLKEMQSDGLIGRQAYQEVPPRVEYYLTEKGRSLEPLLQAILAWGLQHMGQGEEAMEGD